MSDGRTHCPRCSAEGLPGKPFCSECGSPLVGDEDGSRLDTRPRSGPRTPTSDRGGRFVPGMLLAGRYRIVSLLGRGGMGEVYRADDLKLGQSVALKFLPPELERDASLLARLLEEVRLARQVSHPNVCRVYDVGESDGRHFLSMEYVDGEDLASLLRRIGHLPEHKAVEVARQICAGLAAAHEQGILHRDLKPSNVMVDGRGRAKVTDFGLASLEHTVGAAESRSGTPAYMAPEQIAGDEVTTRSDIYALGLVLYEMVTGTAPFASQTAIEAARRRETPPATPSSLVRGIDPALERVILRCLEGDPRDRPASALAVAAALPGGDPLAAALAAGETPSPELVAEAGARGGLRPALGLAALVAVIVLSVVLVVFSGKTTLGGRVPLDRSPEVLTERAREIVRLAGYNEDPVDSLHGFVPNAGYLEHLEREGPQPDPWTELERGQPAGLHFAYRQSQSLLERIHEASTGNWFRDPPPTRPGMVEVYLDTEGRLFAFRAVPPRTDEARDPVAGTDWGPLIEAAGLDPATLEPVPPLWVPPVYADARSAWTGVYPDASDVAIRVEAASYRGKPAAFRIVEPWSRPDDGRDGSPGAWVRARDLLNIVWYLVVLAGASLVAVRNVRLGRGDRKTALRLALLFGALRMVWLLGVHHLPSSAEMDVFIGNLVWAVYRVGLVYVFYLALEPYARRLWPRMLASWVRLFDGRLRDPLVGRDLLIGVLYGTVSTLITAIAVWIPQRLPMPDYPLPAALWSLEALRGTRHAAAALAGITNEGILFMLVGIMMFLVLRVVLRRTWLSVAIVSVLSLGIMAPGSGPVWPFLIFMTVVIALFWWVLFRFGLLVLLLGSAVAGWFQNLPLTFDLTVWYAPATVMALTVILAIAAWGFWTALAGKPLLRDEFLQDEAR